jgi:hypothetical protein
MKLKPGVRIAAGWEKNRLILDVLETLWMSLTPLVCGIMFGISSNITWLIIGMIPLFVKFIYRRETGETIIYLR